MTYNKEQMEVLGKYDSNFHTAVTAGYARALPKGAALEIAAVHEKATGTSLRVYPNCADCVLRLLRMVGTHYLADKEEMAKAAEAAAAAPAREVKAQEKKATRRKAVKIEG